VKLNWGYSILIFLIGFLTLSIGFIVFSFRQNNDLVTNDYYEKGADYTNQMEITNRSAVFADSIQLLNQNTNLLVRFSDSIDQMTDSIHIYFYRPSDKKLDVQFWETLRSDSLIIGKEQLAKGRYQVQFQWKYNRKSYLVEKDFFIK
jgi:hypothetical protein